MAIVSLLTGEFGGTQIKILLTTLTISGASICGMACAAFIEKRGNVSPGGAGIACAFAAAVLSTYGMWSEVNSETYWKATVSLIVAAAAFAYCLLLFIPTLVPSYRWCQTGASLFISLLALQIIVAVWGEIDDANYYRLLGVVTVLGVLLTLMVPIGARLGSLKAKGIDTLRLSHDTEDIYRDSAGQRYRVTKI